MKYILESWKHTIRFMVCVLLLFGLIYFSIIHAMDNSEFDINFANDKTLVTIIDSHEVIAHSMLPACDGWINTGIEVRPGEEFQVKVSGKIHTTGDKMIEDAEHDALPRYEWKGPEGAKFKYRSDAKFGKSDSLRKSMLLKPTANVGAVLFFIQKQSSKGLNCDLRDGELALPEPDSILTYEARGIKGINTTKETWYVWAAVNDVLIRDFSDNSKLAYLGGKTDTLHSRNWDALKNNSYNKVWFDDNLGNFIISAIMKKPHSFARFW